MAKNNLHTQILGIIKKSHRIVLHYLNSLSEIDRADFGTYENWAPKDRLAHINYWQHRCLEALSYISRGQSPPEYPSYEECNRLNFAETKDKTYHMLMRDADTLQKTIPLVLERFTEEDLTVVGRHPHQKESTLLAYILNDFYNHPVFHVSDAYLKLGDLPSANRLQDQMVGDVLGLDDNPRTQGTVLYDRACFHALSGDPDQALVVLQKSLALRPDLKTWALEDNDLESLRGNPQFLALTKDQDD